MDGDQRNGQAQSFQEFMERAHKVGVEVSATNIGQFVLRQAENILSIIEKTAKWTIPPKDNRKSVALVRPLPWILFLPALLFIRWSIVIVMFCTWCGGFEDVDANDLIKYLQIFRRRLRALKFEGQNVIRRRGEKKQLEQLPNGRQSSSGCAGGTIQLIWASFSRASCYQTPDVLKMYTKSSLNASQKANKRGKRNVEPEDSDSDSSDVSADLKAFMARSYSDESDDSEDENFEIHSDDEDQLDDDDDDDIYLSDASESGEEDQRNDLHNNHGTSQNPAQNGEASSKEHNQLANSNNGAVVEESEEAAEAIEASENLNKGRNSGRGSNSNSSNTPESKSPPPEENRESSKENISVPEYSGTRTKARRHSNPINRAKINRNPKKVNGDNNHQRHRSHDHSVNNTQSVSSSKQHNNSNFQSSKTTKRPQI